MRKRRKRKPAKVKVKAGPAFQGLERRVRAPWRVGADVDAAVRQRAAAEGMSMGVYVERILRKAMYLPLVPWDDL